MTRVAVLFEYPSLNGGEFSFLSMVPQLKAAGIRLSAIANPQGDLGDFLRKLEIEIHPFRTAKSESDSTRLSQAELRERLADVISEVSPDLIHANSLAMSRLVGPVTRRLGQRSVGHLRDILTLRKIVIANINQLDHVLAVSAATANHHIKQGLQAERLEVLYNGVDLERFQVRAKTGYLQEELGIPAGSRLIGTIGQLGFRKAVDIALRAAEVVAAQHEDVHWVIVGERHSVKEESIEYEQFLHQLATRGYLAGRVHFVGRRRDVPRLLSELTMLVHAAHQEPLGRVLLEAAASGCPVVATDVGGTQEIFGHSNPAARLVRRGDWDGIAREVNDLLTDHSSRQELSVRARGVAQSNFDVRLRGSELARVYERVVATG